MGTTPHINKPVHTAKPWTSKPPAGGSCQAKPEVSTPPELKPIETGGSCSSSSCKIPTPSPSHVPTPSVTPSHEPTPSYDCTTPSPVPTPSTTTPSETPSVTPSTTTPSATPSTPTPAPTPVEQERKGPWKVKLPGGAPVGHQRLPRPINKEVETPTTEVNPTGELPDGDTTPDPTGTVIFKK